MDKTLTQDQQEFVGMIRDFGEKEIAPVILELDDGFKFMGLFEIIPTKWTSNAVVKRIAYFATNGNTKNKYEAMAFGETKECEFYWECLKKTFLYSAKPFLSLFSSRETAFCITART